jgi:hypothetical protein
MGCLCFAQTPDWLWANSGGGTNSDWGYDIVVDSNGNSYVTGYFWESAVFGTNNLSGNGADVFVAKMGENGNWLWAASAGGSDQDIGYAISVDGSGNCYVAGEFRGTAVFGSTNLISSGTDDIFIAKLDSNGNWLWAKRAGGSLWDHGLGIAVDNEGNCYVTGYFNSSTAAFGSTTLTNSGNADLFVAKLDTNGNWLWVQQPIGTDWEECYSIALDNEGNSYISGRFLSTVWFGTTSLTSSGDYDIFVAKLNPSGNWLWAKRAGGTDEEGAQEIAVDSSGNCFLTGYFQGSAYIGPAYLNSHGEQDIFCAKLDTNGNWLWAVRAGGETFDTGQGIDADTEGNCYITGYFGGINSYFGLINLICMGSFDVFVCKIDSAGNWLWAVRAGDVYEDCGFGLAADGFGNIYLTGYFLNNTSFGNFTLASPGFDADMFIAKYGVQVTNEDDTIPSIFGLSQLYDAYPNPGRQNQTITIETDIAKGDAGILSVYNLKGQLVKSFGLQSGRQQLAINSSQFPAGVYLYRMNTQTANETKKLVLLK